MMLSGQAGSAAMGTIVTKTTKSSSDIANCIRQLFFFDTHNDLGVRDVSILRQEAGESSGQLPLLLRRETRCKHVTRLSCSRVILHYTKKWEFKRLNDKLTLTQASLLLLHMSPSKTSTRSFRSCSLRLASS